MQHTLLSSLLLGLAPSLLAQVATEFEPNDTASQANFVVCGQQLEATCGFVGDFDWYTFTLAAPGRVTVLTGTGPNGVVFDNEIELYDGTLALLARNDDDDREWQATVSEYLPAGTYYVLHKGFGNNTGIYSIDIQCDPLGTATVRVPEAVEPNNDPLVGGLPTILLPGRAGDGDLTIGDSDWWQFTLTGTTVCRIETGRGLSGTFSPDTFLYLRDATGALLESDDDDAPGAWSLVLATLPAGTYYADVQGFSGTNPGTYTLRLQTWDLPVTFPENAEPNGNPLQGGLPSVLACGIPGEGELSGGDSDWWSFSLGQDTFVDLSTFGGRFQNGLTTIQNPVLNLYDGSGVLLQASNGNTYYDRHERLRRWLSAGSYYAEVVSGATATGTYTLRLTCDESALYHTFAGGCVGSNAQVPTWRVRYLEQPLVGTTLVGEFRNAPANGVVFPFAGFSRTVASGGIPLPLDLGIVGAPGCVIEVDPAYLTALFTDAAGTAVWALPIPQNPSLSGIVLAQQAFVLDPTVNALGLTITNSGHGLITNQR
jgi:hypothetical protein